MRDFRLTEDETAVVEAARQVAASADSWVALVAGGWLDLLAGDRDAGGDDSDSGAQASEGLGYLGLVAEELGAAGVSVPLIGTAVVWPTLFGCSAGGRRVGVADGPDGVDRVGGAEATGRADGTEGGGRAEEADGTAGVGGGGRLCEDGAGAEVVIVLAEDGAEAYGALSASPVGRLDGDGLARVSTKETPVAVCGPGAGGRVAEARRRAAAVAASEMAGAIRRISETTCAYVGERQQFGRPVAAFQVVAHGAARLATLAEAATWSARLACRSSEPEHTLAAKGWISQASADATALAHQLHGAVGFTEEYGLQRLTKRLRILRFAWGDDRSHHLALGRLRSTPPA